MISPFVSKLAVSVKWIFAVAVAWSIALALVARGTANLRDRHTSSLRADVDTASDDTNQRLLGLQQENDRLQKELENLPQLRATVAELQKQLAPSENKSVAAWAAQSNALQAAIEQTKREVAELARWSSQWHLTKQIEEAKVRLAEKAKEFSANPEKQYAETKETLSKLALARKQLIELRNQLSAANLSEKDQLRSRLAQAQGDWMAANNQLGKDNVLYQPVPMTNDAQDASTVLIMRSIIPDQNGVSVNVFLDGTVKFSTAQNSQ